MKCLNCDREVDAPGTHRVDTPIGIGWLCKSADSALEEAVRIVAVMIESGMMHESERVGPGWSEDPLAVADFAQARARNIVHALACEFEMRKVS